VVSVVRLQHVMVLCWRLQLQSWDGVRALCAGAQVTAGCTPHIPWAVLSATCPAMLPCILLEHAQATSLQILKTTLTSPVAISAFDVNAQRSPHSVLVIWFVSATPSKIGIGSPTGDPGPGLVTQEAPIALTLASVQAIVSKPDW
jgi:hypothetical protein